MSHHVRVALLILVTLALLIGLWFVSALHADRADYAKFAGDHSDGFIPNPANVLSNLGFLVVGIAGVMFVRARRAQLGDDSAAAWTLFVGVVLTAFGSAYFHLSPLRAGKTNPDTLLPDRLPMTIAFAGLLALVLSDRVLTVHRRGVLAALVVIGMGTVAIWYLTGDLYPYAFFQLFAALGPLLMIMSLRPKWSEAGYVIAGIVLFGLAKFFEDFDELIYVRTKFLVSGHSLKHIAGAFAVLMILLWLIKRRKVTPQAQPHPRR